MPRVRRAPKQAEFAWDKACFQAYMELREQVRHAPELPEDYDAVTELAKMGELLAQTDKGRISPLRFLVLKEVASYTHPRMAAGDVTVLAPTVRRGLPPPPAPNGTGPDLSRFVRKTG